MAIVKRIYKTKISYLARVRDPNGKLYPSRNFDNRSEAVLHEAELLQKKKKGNVAISMDSKLITVAELWEVWSQDSVRKAGEGWRITQNQMYRDYIAPIIGKMCLADVTKPVIGTVMKVMEEKGLSGNHRKNVYSLMHTIFSDAVEYYEILAANPVTARFHRPKVVERDRVFLKPAQTLSLLQSTRESYLGPPTWLGGLTALRNSEIQGLLGEDLHFDEGYIQISRAYNRKTKKMQGFPKQKEPAKVPIPPVLADYLRSLNVGPKEFVAPGPNGGMLSYDTYYKTLKRFCKKIGLPEMTSHLLRHSCTELWVDQGASAEDIRRLLNQSSLDSTKRYIHRSDERLTRMSAGIGLRVIPGGLDLGKELVHESVHSRQQTDERVAAGDAV